MNLHQELFSAGRDLEIMTWDLSNTLHDEAQTESIAL